MDTKVQLLWAHFLPMHLAFLIWLEMCGKFAVIITTLTITMNLFKILTQIPLVLSIQ